MSRNRPVHLPFVGIDDFAFKKRLSYGTLIVDQLTRKVLDILPTRRKEAVTSWLVHHADIQVVSRDGSKTYKKAISAANPSIVQVSDRWHLLKNLFDASKKALFHIIPARWTPSKEELEGGKQDAFSTPVRKTDYARIQNEEKKWTMIQEVHHLKAEGYSISHIARELHMTRNTVYGYLTITSRPSGRRGSRYDRFRPLIRSLLKKGKSVKQIEQTCREDGYEGCSETINTMAAEERRREKENRSSPLYMRQKVLHLLWEAPDETPKQQLMDLHPQFSQSFPQVFDLYHVIDSFRNLLSEKDPGQLENWVSRCHRTEFSSIHSFTSSLTQDLPAVLNVIREPWSNGLTEGHINKLKLIKRSMYRRARFSLLRIKLLLAQSSL